MKILCITHDYPPTPGGAAYVTHSLNKNFVEAGQKVIVLTSDLQRLPAEDIIDGVDLLRIPSKKKELGAFKIWEMFTFIKSAFFRSARIAKSVNPDVIHSHFTIPCGIIAYFLSHKFKKPFLITMHGGDVPGGKSERFYKVYHFFLKPLLIFLWKKADALVAVSEGVRELALKTYQKVNIYVIPNGIDSEFYKSDSHNERSPNKDIIKIIFVGKLIHIKGLQYFLPALKEVINKTDKKLVFRIVGKGVYQKNLETQARELGIEQFVEFCGFKNPEEIKELLLGSDIFALPSISEGMPIALLEAMACGLPVVASDIRGIRQIIKNGENGYLAPVGDEEKIKEALLNLINSPEQRLAMRAKNLAVTKNYDWQNIASRYLQIFEKIISKQDSKKDLFIK